MWPALVLMTPRRRLPTVLLVVAAIGVASRIAIILAHVNSGAPASIQTPTTSNFDPLAVGALLAWAHWRDFPRAAIVRATRVALSVGLTILAVVALYSVHFLRIAPPAIQAVEPVGAALISVFLVDRAAVGFARGKLTAFVLEAPPVAYLGGISYGIYLWHDPIHAVLRQHVPIAARAFVATPLGGATYFVVVLAVTVAMASASWFLVERPLNSLKRHFPYRKRGDGAAQRSLASLWPPLASE